METSIAVAVIGLLSSIAVPSFRDVRSNSLNHAKESNVRLLNHAVEIWAMDNMRKDDDLIGEGITNYIKGGFHQLNVGKLRVNVTNILDKTVGDTLTVEDIY